MEEGGCHDGLVAVVVKLGIVESGNGFAATGSVHDFLFPGHVM